MLNDSWACDTLIRQRARVYWRVVKQHNSELLMCKATINHKCHYQSSFHSAPHNIPCARIDTSCLHLQNIYNMPKPLLKENMSHNNITRRMISINLGQYKYNNTFNLCKRYLPYTTMCWSNDLCIDNQESNAEYVKWQSQFHLHIFGWCYKMLWM